VYLPFGHSPDVDLIAELDSSFLRIQVKTSTQTSTTPRGESRCAVRVATSGGNRTWTGIQKRLEPSNLDYLFILTGNGRRWCIPAGALEADTSITLGGVKYSEFEIEPVTPIRQLIYEDGAPLDSGTTLGEYPRGQRMAAVNRPAPPSQVRLLPPPFSQREGSNFEVTKYERGLGKSGHTQVNYKRRVTIPQRAAEEARLKVGDRLRVSPAGYGRLILERVELPNPPQPELTTPGAPEPEEAA
jgi:hypothetical protein